MGATRAQHPPDLLKKLRHHATIKVLEQMGVVDRVRAAVGPGNSVSQIVHDNVP
jgi:hypothetical protein